MKTMNRADAIAVLESAGVNVSSIDWSKIDWAKVVQLVIALISLFKSTPASRGAPADVAAACATHFEAIKALAECGCDCCAGGA